MGLRGFAAASVDSGQATSRRQIDRQREIVVHEGIVSKYHAGALGLDIPPTLRARRRG
jgi:hypothetical protein